MWVTLSTAAEGPIYPLPVTIAWHDLQPVAPPCDSHLPR